MKIKVAIADDHPMIISGLKNLLADYAHITVTGSYSNGKELLQGLQDNLPDILLLDIQLPDTTGVDLVPILLKSYQDLKVLTLTNLDSALYIHNMLRHGVQGYALKTIDPNELVDAIEVIYNGGRFIDPSIREKVNNFAARAKKETFLKARLTPREKEVLNLVVNGFTGQEIAEKLFVGLKTVEYYRINLLLKLDAKNTATLVKRALEQGLTD